MFRTVQKTVWAFDLEWVPDPAAGRLLYCLPHSMPDSEVLDIMWEKGGASEEDPTPYLKTVLCRVVSVAAVVRQVIDGGRVRLQLLSLPKVFDGCEKTGEADVIGPFLQGLGKIHPQLVGFNSAGADLKILVQRGTILGLEAPGFCQRPEKPWGGPDYFSTASEWNVDLMKILGGGKSTPSLNEIARLSGIPGKMSIDGEQVARLWLEGRLKDIVCYNECDALSTYLVWLRLAHFAGHFTNEHYEYEKRELRRLLLELGQDDSRSHLPGYVEEWDRLQSLVDAAQHSVVF